MNKKQKELSEDQLRKLAPFLGCSCYEELKLKEAIYNCDVNHMFEKYCKENLGLCGLRLELFYD